MLFDRKWRDPAFGVGSRGLTIAVCTACAQKLAAVGAPVTRAPKAQFEREAARTPQCKHCLGNIMSIQGYIMPIVVSTIYRAKPFIYQAHSVIVHAYSSI